MPYQTMKALGFIVTGEWKIIYIRTQPQWQKIMGNERKNTNDLKLDMKKI